MTVDKMAIFDLDGTLNDIMMYAVKSYQLGIKDMGIPNNISEEQIRSMFGAPWNTITKALLPDIFEEQASELTKNIDKYEFELMEKYGRAFPGVTESLEALRHDGYFISVCSNSKIVYINKVLSTIKIDHLIDYKQELHDGCKKQDMVKLVLDKFNPSVAVMIGDRVYDMEAAQVNNIPFVACLYGCAPDEMKNEKYKIETAHDIYSMVKHALS